MAQARNHWRDEMSSAFNTPADIDAIVLSVLHNGRASDDMTYLRDLVAAGMRAAPPVDAVPGEPIGIEEILKLAKQVGAWDGGLPSDWNEGDILFSPEQLDVFVRAISAPITVPGEPVARSACPRCGWTRGHDYGCPNDPLNPGIADRVREAKRIAREYALMRASDEECFAAIDALATPMASRAVGVELMAQPDGQMHYMPLVF
jgi:hypothetical protein